MHATLFNVCMALAWLLVLAGGLLIHPGAGLCFAGLLLIALALLAAQMAGGLYTPDAPQPGDPT